MLEWYDLNSRHEAAALWVGAFLLYAVGVSSAVRKSIFNLAKVLLQKTILLSFVGLFMVVTILTTVVVSAGRFIGFWETLPVVTVLVWSLGSGASLLMNLNHFLEEDGEFRRASAVLTPATIIAALMNIAILHIWWEVALLPILAILSFMFAYYKSKGDGQYLHNTAKTALILYTLVIVSLAIKDIVEEPNAWKSLVQGVLLPVCLSIGTLLYIRFLILVEQWRFRFRCPSRVVSSTEYGSDWPLTVNSAKLCCKHRAVWVEVCGKKYGVNGNSRVLLRKWGYTSFDFADIWKDHPDIEGIKVSVHRLIQDGLALEHR